MPVTNAHAVAQRLRAIAARAQQLPDAIGPTAAQEVGDAIQRSIQRPQPPLKPSTVRQRIAEGYPAGPPLQKTGTLFRSLDHLEARPHDATSVDIVAVGAPKYLAHQLVLRRQHIDTTAQRAITDAYRAHLYGWSGASATPTSPSPSPRLPSIYLL